VSAVIARPATPFKGLAAFEDSELDALFFFGRERERAVIAANLMASRLTLFYGESGVGKSSLLAAGVVRELRALAPGAVVALHDTWSGSLAGVLDEVRTADEAYLILDQFEEYFLYHGDHDRPGTLLRDLPDLLLETRANVLIALREDALAKLDAFKAGIPAVFANQIRLEQLDRDSARTAVVGPLERWNELTGESVEIEPALVEAVLDEVLAGSVDGHAPDRDRIEAPYLQLVLERLWETERATGSTVLRLATLRALGGATTIVRAHLRDALATLTADEQDVAAEMFEHLVTPSGTKIAHRAPDLAQYAHVQEGTLQHVLAALTRDRIVHSVDSSDRYEIFHDVLTEPIQVWRQERRLELERRESGRRQRRLLIFAVVAAAALACVTAVALFALAQRGHARAQARHARAGELAATALADLGRDPVRGLQHALSAARLERTQRVADVLRTALLGSDLRLVLPAGGAVTSASFSADSGYAVVGGADGRATVYDVVHAKRVAALRVRGPVEAASFSSTGHTVLVAGGGRVLIEPLGGRSVSLRKPRVSDAGFSFDGRVVVAGGGHTVRLWRADGALVATFSVPGTVSHVALDRAGDRVAAAWSGPGAVDHVALFDTQSGRQLADLRGSVLAFSPAGDLLATGDPDQLARVYSDADGRLLFRLGHGAAVTSVAFDPSESRLATSSADGAARVWNLRTGLRELLMPSGTTVVERVRYSADGRFLVTAGGDGVTRVWNARNGRELATLSGHRDAISDAAFSRNARLVLTASDDGTARVWAPGLADQLRVVERFGSPLVASGFSADGSRSFGAAASGAVSIRSRAGRESIAVGARLGDAAIGGDGKLVATLRTNGAFGLWRDGKRVLGLRVPPPGRRVAFSDDGARVLVAGGRRLVVVDTSTLRRVSSRQLRGRVTDARFGPGRAIVVGTSTGTVETFEPGADRGRRFDAGPNAVAAVALSPDGTLVAAAGRDGVARIWATASGRLQHALKRARTPLSDLEFSHDGRFLATAAIGGDARLWAVAHGQLVHVLHAHVGRVARVAFSPDDGWLTTAGPTSVGLWQTLTGRFLFYLRGHTGQVERADFAPDGHRILTSSDDGTLRSYACAVCGSVYELAHLARVRLSGVSALLTLRQRKRYLGG
jgi:WD40 repeat protein